MESAQSFDRDNRSLPQSGNGSSDRSLLLSQDFAFPADELNLRSTVRAGIGLGVEAPVRGILIFIPTPGAHGEGCHRGLRPVIGKVLDDGKARAAMRAIDKRIAVTTIGRVEQLTPAFLTESQVRRDRGADTVPRIALYNLKPRLLKTSGSDSFHLHAQGCHGRGRLAFEVSEKTIERLR
jgi:hypothetical protein